VKRGSSENYLKDQSAFDDYLIEGGLDGAILKADGGERRSGRDLRSNVERARSFAHVLDGLHMRYSRTVVEQAAIAGLLNPKLVNDEGEAERLAGKVVERLKALSEETEQGWSWLRGPDGGFVFSREVRGVKESHNIEWALIQSADARKLHTYHAEFSELFSGKLVLERKSAHTPVFGPRSLLDAVFAAGRAGLTMQRYKGLGEMNPEQLRETTLDPNVRTLMQVKLGELNDADEIFSKLMGDVVEPRREFIQQNALSVSNLDI
jgi:DNA gyrase subunit B